MQQVLRFKQIQIYKNNMIQSFQNAENTFKTSVNTRSAHIDLVIHAIMFSFSQMYAIHLYQCLFLSRC